MKVFHLIDSGGFFGAERVLVVLAQQQMLHGHDVTIISAGKLSQAEKPIEVEAQKIGLPVIKWRGGIFRKLVDIAKANPSAFFHSHGYKFNILLAALMFANKNMKAVATVHGYTNAPAYSKLWLYYLINRLALKKLKGIAFVSSQAAEASRIKLTRNNKVIFNGMPDKSAVSGIDFSSGSCPDYLIAVGRLSPEKAFDNLLLAFNKVAAKYPDISLVLVGDGPERDKLKALAKNNYRVVFKGQVDNPIPLIENSRALIISSNSEGLPVVLLEAMRAGRDIVSTSVGAIPDVLNHQKNGILCEPGNDLSLYHAIDAVLQLQKGVLGDAAKACFRENFTAEKMYIKYDDWYQFWLEGR